MDLIRRVEGVEAFALTSPLVIRSDGKKMGKSEKGALYLDPGMTSPYEFYQYWLNVPDADVEQFHAALHVSARRGDRASCARRGTRGSTTPSAVWPWRSPPWCTGQTLRAWRQTHRGPRSQREKGRAISRASRRSRFPARSWSRGSVSSTSSFVPLSARRRATPGGS